MLRARRFGISIAGLLLLFLSAVRTAGQGPTTGALAVSVTDSAGIPLQGVEVTVSDPLGGFDRSGETSAVGGFTAGFLLPGEYEIFAERLGYRPIRRTGVLILAGGRLDLTLALAPAEGVMTAADVTPFASALEGGRRAGYGQWLARRGMMLRLPEEERELPGVGRLSSESSEELEAQGLPGYLSQILVNGAPAGGVRHPRAPSGLLRGASLPLSAFDQAELVTGDPDVEWNAPGGVLLNAQLRRGTRAFRANAFGDWGSAALLDGNGSALSGDPRGDARAGFSMSGPIIPDTASFVIGAEVWSLGSFGRAPAGSSDSLAAVIGRLAEERFGVSPTPATPGGLATPQVRSAFGRFDWQLTPAHFVSVYSTAASLSAAPLPGLSRDWPAASGSATGLDLVGGLTLLSRLSRVVSHEVRAGLESSRREYDAGSDGAADDLTPTRIVAGATAFGADPRLAGRFRETAVRMSETVHLSLRSHRIKLGLSAGWTAWSQTDRYGRAGEFTFSGVEEFGRSQGYFRQTLGPAATASFSVPQLAAYVQDTWIAAPGLQILLGLRYDTERLPLEKLGFDQEWFDRTGLPDTIPSPLLGRFGPRIGFVWNVQEQNRWIVRAAGGVYTGGVDPSILGELRMRDGRLQVRRGFGDLRRWPGAPDSVDAPITGTILTLAAPALRGPRTARATAGLSGLVGSRTSIHLSGVYRRTDFLVRRNDLNLLSAPSGEDQYGRPIFGTLRQQGRLLAPEGGSNRRFADFDVVSALNVDGWSEHQGVTLAVEGATRPWLTLMGSYTYSRTRDNWMFARTAGVAADLSPLPDSVVGTAWDTGRSDFDLPHRAVVAAEVDLPDRRGTRVGALYRYRSGYPFTPGFTAGVDANGDGSGGNDPAFVDAAVPGMRDLLARWTCLADQEGGFVARNSCRTPGEHSLDLRVSTRLIRHRRFAAEVVVDGLNLLGADRALPDTGLLLVDERRSLGTRGGVTTVPLRANPGFGLSSGKLEARPVLRLGLHVSY